MMARTQRLNEIVRQDPAVDYVTSSLGNQAPNAGFLFVALKPRDQRDDINVVMSRLRRASGQVPGITLVLQPVQNINLNSGRQSRAQYQYTMQGADLGALYAAAPDMRDRMTKLNELRDVSIDLQLTNPQLVVDIDREKAANLGVTSDAIRQTLYNMFGSRQISTIYTPSSDYQVIMEADRRFQTDPSALSRIFVKSSTGANVPLEAVATIRRNIGPLSVSRIAQQPAVSISFNLAPGIALGDAVQAIKRLEREAGLSASITTGFAGSAQLFQEALKGQGFLILAAVLVIYIVLGILYESFIHPITILSGLPSAGLGALIALKVYGMDLSVIAIIGILMLIGIVKKNAIMMVDFAIEKRGEGVDALSAVREAALIRFRPIMMTTFAAIFGVLPIAIGAGAGSELRQPLGIAVVGGLMVSQLLTLFITPVVYFYLDKVETWTKRGGRPVKAAKDVEAAAATVPVASHAAFQKSE
jgi:HAE1 family hydrophobic/amphiphilic exporter-1